MVWVKDMDPKSMLRDVMTSNQSYTETSKFFSISEEKRMKKGLLFQGG